MSTPGHPPTTIDGPEGVGALAPDAAAFLGHMDRCRRRLLLVELWRRILVVGALAIVLAAVASVLKASPALHLLARLGVVTAAVLGAVWAWRGRPTLRRTAQVLDLRTGDDNELATALQFARADDPVAQIVCRRASARLAALDPRVVLPLEAPPHAGRLVVAVAVAAVVWTIDRTASSPRWPLSGASAVMSGGAAQRPSSRDRDADAPDTRGGEPPVGTAAAAPVGEAGSAAPVVSSSASDVPDPVARGADLAEPRPSGDPRTSAGVGGASADARAADGGADAANAGERQSAATTDDGRGTRPPARGDGTGAGRGASATGAGSVDGAGGVTYGSRVSPSDRSADAVAPNTPAYAARYRAARERAEAAVRHERIPPHLRVHVREYFANIRPPGTP